MASAPSVGFLDIMAASTTCQVHLPKLVPITAVRGQGAKPKAGYPVETKGTCSSTGYTVLCLGGAIQAVRLHGAQ